MAFDSVRNRTVLFGGGPGIGSFLADTLLWDGESWTLMATTTGPAARERHAMAFDALRGRTVLFGGWQPGPVFLGDTWEWDGEQWELVAESGPAPRRGHVMAATARGVVIFGGRTYDPAPYLSDVWHWDGVTWTQLTVSGPEGRLSASMAYDSRRDRAVLFGGVTDAGTYPAATWQLDVGSGFPALAAPPVSLVGQPGQSATFSVAASGAPSLAYQWRLNGAALANGGSFSGVNTPSLAVNPVLPELAGTYSVQVSNSCGALTSPTAQLTVLPCYANCDNSTGTPALNAGDFACFMNRFAAGEIYANCDASTHTPVLSGNDFQCFLNRFAAGCP